VEEKDARKNERKKIQSRKEREREREGGGRRENSTTFLGIFQVLSALRSARGNVKVQKLEY
jgi:hypothetical protein